MRSVCCGAAFRHQQEQQHATFTEECLTFPPKLKVGPKPRVIKPTIGKYANIEVPSGYLGNVNVNALQLGSGNIGLLTVVPGLPGQQSIYVKIIDAQQNRLDAANITYPLSYLASLPFATVNIQELKANAVIINNLKPKPNKTPEEKQKLTRALAYNCKVDALFNMCNYIEFIQKKIGLNNVVDGNVLIAIVNVPKFDNAFFTGSYIVFGNGNTMFYPLVTLDICGHELGHAIVQKYAKLIYQGHSGALNESTSDVFGQQFEEFSYEKYNKDGNPNNNLKGVPDWDMGEDCGKSIRILRNMKDPTDCPYPQPKIYRGQYWADPNSQDDDGGVHQNSGCANGLFYQITTMIGKEASLNLWVQTLKTLPKNCSYIQFRDLLKAMAAKQNVLPQVQQKLNEVGLTDAAVSDWKQ